MARRTFNAIGSTADIAFLLLCYFLLTTTMGDQSGLQRRLPPIPDSQQAQDQKVNRRNIIIVRINSADKLFAGSEAMDISFLKEKIKEFLTNPKGLVKIGIAVVAAAVLFGICYLLASGAPALNCSKPTTPGELKLTDTILNLAYLVGGAAILSIICGEVLMTIRNKK